MISAIILAGGKGKRMGSAISKQFIDIKGKPIIYYTLKKFSENKKIDNIIVVLPEDEVKYFKENILKKYELRINKIVIGGKERQDSVKNSSTDIVLIHDGARPFISERIINEGIKFAEIYGAAAPGVMPKDTIKVKNEKNFSVDTPNRANLVLIQTPQVFKSEDIKVAYQKAKDEGYVATDDSQLFERYIDKDIKAVLGDYSNLKITTQEDLK